MSNPNLDDVRHFLSQETGLATVSTTQADGRVLSSVVNCGVIDHPATSQPHVGLVSRGAAARLGHIRRGSEVTVAVRRGWNWVAVTGPAELIGPDDPSVALDQDGTRLLIRDVFTAAGGTHDDFDEYDRVMAQDRRVAVLITPDRIVGNMPAG